MSDRMDKSETPNAVYEQVVQGLLQAISLRDMETISYHTRVAELSGQLGRAMQLTDPLLIDLRYGALLHDIGRLGVPDSILFKQGALTEHEHKIMKRHTLMGAAVLRPIEFLRGALVIVEAHHERWDGAGYPLGLREQEIPLLARIVAVAETFDALTSTRFYRLAWPPEQSLKHIADEAGQAFDPEIVKVFVEMLQAQARGFGEKL